MALSAINVPSDSLATPPRGGEEAVDTCRQKAPLGYHPLTVFFLPLPAAVLQKMVLNF